MAGCAKLLRIRLTVLELVTGLGPLKLCTIPLKRGKWVLASEKPFYPCGPISGHAARRLKLLRLKVDSN